MSDDVSDRTLTRDEETHLKAWMRSQQASAYWSDTDVAYDATALAENAANALTIYGKGVSIPEGVFELSRHQTDAWERERSRRLDGVSETMALHQRGDFRRSHHLLGRGGR